jgi:hypothetical protein
MSRTEQVLYDPEGHLIAHCPTGSADSADTLSQCRDAEGQLGRLRVVVSKVDAKSQAEDVGLHPGDVLETYAGLDIAQMDGLRRLVADPSGGPRKLVIRRDAQRAEFTLRPGRIGISMEMKFVPDPELGSAKVAQ